MRTPVWRCLRQQLRSCPSILSMKRPNPLREECLASLFLRHLWREVLHLRVLPRSGLTHSGLLRDPGDQALCSCTSLVYLKFCPHRSFPSAPFCLYRSSDRKGYPGDGRRAHAQTRKIFVMKAVAFRRSEPQLRGYQIQPEGATHLYTAWEASTLPLPSSALLALTDISWLKAAGGVGWASGQRILASTCWRPAIHQRVTAQRSASSPVRGHLQG